MASFLWFLICVLVVFWVLGFFVAHLGSLLHILLVVVVVLVIYNLVMRNRTL